MPVLARVFEQAGLSTVTVTMMPRYAERAGIPRALGVPFPFGHPLGRPGDAAMQTTVIRHALRVLKDATEPNTVFDLDYDWPEPQDVAYRAWQPREMSPIVRFMRGQILARRAADQQGGRESHRPGSAE